MTSCDATVSQLRETFKSGKTKDLAWRREQLEQIHRMIAESHEQITAAVCTDLGGDKLRGVGEFATVAAAADMALDNLDNWAQERTLSGFFNRECIRPEPKGVVLIIAPWNFPFNLLLTPLAAAVAAGNCVVLKPSELVPTCDALIAQLVLKYLDKDCIRVISGGPDVASRLLQQRWDHIMYTGGGTHAAAVAKHAAANLTTVTLELGGKSPVIVDSGAQMDATIERIHAFKWMNAGQICVAPDYILCHESRTEELTSRLLERVKASYGANPKESPEYGRIVNENHVARIQRLIETSGGSVLCGGVSEIDKTDRYVPPTIITGASLDSPIMKEEIFGPVLPILTYKSLDEAMNLVNKKDTPLAAYMFSQDSANIEKWLTSVESGGASVNTTMEHILSESLPFGGKGSSGSGKYHGKFGFDEFSHMRAVMRKSTLPGMRSSRIPAPKAGKPSPDIIYKIAAMVTIGIIPRPLKCIMRQQMFRQCVKVALAAAFLRTFGPQIRYIMEFLGA